MIIIIPLAILIAIGMAILLIAVIRADDEQIIGHTIQSPVKRADIVDPRKCLHAWQTDGTIVDGRRRNRHQGIHCARCEAILWEDGAITVTRGRHA